MPNAKVGLVEEWVHERVRPKFPAKSTYRECSLAKFPPAAHRGRGIRNESQSEGSPFLSCLGENFGVYFLMQHFLNARN